jgi:hypothetical protein
MKGPTFEGNKGIFGTEKKILKITHHLNMLCSMSEEDGKLIDAIANS